MGEVVWRGLREAKKGRKLSKTALAPKKLLGREKTATPQTN